MVTCIHDAEVYEVGSTLTHRGTYFIVLEDRGDAIWIGVPERTSETKGGEVVRVAGNRTMTVSKADLILEAL
jgi:hypothetical protein